MLCSTSYHSTVEFLITFHIWNPLIYQLKATRDRWYIFFLNFHLCKIYSHTRELKTHESWPCMLKFSLTENIHTPVFWMGLHRKNNYRWVDLYLHKYIFKFFFLLESVFQCNHNSMITTPWIGLCNWNATSNQMFCKTNVHLKQGRRQEVNQSEDITLISFD